MIAHPARCAGYRLRRRLGHRARESQFATSLGDDRHEEVADGPRSARHGDPVGPGGCASSRLPYTPVEQPPGARISASCQIIEDRLKIEIDCATADPGGRPSGQRAMTENGIDIIYALRHPGGQGGGNWEHGSLRARPTCMSPLVNSTCEASQNLLCPAVSSRSMPCLGLAVPARATIAETG